MNRRRSKDRRRRWRLRRRVPRATLALLASLAGLFVVLWLCIAYLQPDSSGRNLSLDTFQGVLEHRGIFYAVVQDEDARIRGRIRTPDGDKGELYWVAYPRNDSTLAQLITKLTQSSARVEVDPQSGKAIVRLLTTTLLPLMILANLFALFFTAGRGAAAGIGEVLDFSRIQRGGSRRTSLVTFSDAAGVDEAVVELREVVDYLTNPERYAALAATPPKGVLLFGPPGCGKTLLARAVAGEARVPFFSVAGAEFVESLVGVGAARVRDLFARVRSVSPAIVFIDELDAAGRRRGSGASSGGAEEREQTLNQLLVEMDGFDVSSGIVVMAATNRPDMLDPALLRPGRFDRHITVERPDRERRHAILALHARRRPLAPGVDLEAIARQTPGFTGADLANVVNEAALLTIREGREVIDQPTLGEAVQRVLAGPQRRGHLLTEEERSRVASHEAGHAIAAAAVGRGAEVHRVSIVARGRGLGGVTMGRDEDHAVLTRSQIRARIVVALAGRAAEDLMFDEPSTGSEDDIELATALARDVIGRYGMSEGLGLPRLLETGADEYLGATAATGDISQQTQGALDKEVRTELDAAFEQSKSILRSNRDALQVLAAELVRVESIEGAALAKMLPTTAAPRPRSFPRGTARSAR
jgi:cell division protease FtsH